MKKFIDQITLFNLILKISNLLTGPVTAFLITIYFSKTLQGYYYTFSSLTSLTIFVELGLGLVIQNFASHEWVNLKRDQEGNIHGSPNSLSNLRSIFQFSANWFSKSVSLLFIILSVGGYFYFGRSNFANINWIYQWLSLSFVVCLNVLLTPIWSILEGCNQLRSLYFFRIIQSILTNFFLWVSIILKLNLWVPVIAIFISFLCSFLYIYITHFNFIKSLLISEKDKNNISWKKDILPMQWRIAISWIFGYLSSYIFLPIIFKFQGPEIAGKFGITWTLVTSIGNLSNAWLSPKIPEFAMLVSEKKYITLNKVFTQTAKYIIAVQLILTILLILSILFLSNLKLSYFNIFIERFLNLKLILILLVSQFFTSGSNLMASYLRSFKKEPLLLHSIMSGVFICTTTFYFSKYYTINHVVISYAIMSFVIFSFIFLTWSRTKKLLV